MLIAVAAAAPLLLIGPIAGSNAALAPPITAKTAKQAGGPYTSGIKNAKIRPGKEKTLYFEVADADSATDEVTVQGFAQAASEGYKIRWFSGKRQRTNITSQIFGSGFELTVPAGKARYLNALVKNKGQGDPFCIGIDAETESPPFNAFATFSVNDADCISR